VHSLPDETTVSVRMQHEIAPARDGMRQVAQITIPSRVSRVALCLDALTSYPVQAQLPERMP
jgi:hypothetical protein